MCTCTRLPNTHVEVSYCWWQAKQSKEFFTDLNPHIRHILDLLQVPSEREERDVCLIAMVLLYGDPIKQVEHVAPASVCYHYYVLEVSPSDQLLVVVVVAPTPTARGAVLMCGMSFDPLTSFLLLGCGGLLQGKGQHGKAFLAIFHIHQLGRSRNLVLLGSPFNLGLHLSYYWGWGWRWE